MSTINLSSRSSTTTTSDTMTCSAPSSSEPPRRRIMFRRLHSSPGCLETSQAESDNTFLYSTKNSEMREMPVRDEGSERETSSSLDPSRPTTKRCNTASVTEAMSSSVLRRAVTATVDPAVASEQPVSPRNQNALKRKVSFGHIKIREHPRALGDHPSVSSGPALSLGWYSEDGTCPYSRTKELPLDEYEKERGKPRSRRDIIVPRHERQQILLEEVGIPYSDLYAFQKETALLKRSRKKSAKCRKAIMEDKLETTSPPVIKMLQRVGQQLFSFHQNEAQEHSRERKQLDELMDRARAAERIRQQHDVAYWEAQKNVEAMEPESSTTGTTATTETNSPTKDKNVPQSHSTLHHSASEPFFLSLEAGCPDSTVNSDPTLEF